jgi:hypothetical protein
VPTQPINIITENATTEELINELAKFQKIVRYLMNGGLDSENIRANSITADRMDVNELSAITANIGEVTAGIITGILIQNQIAQGNRVWTDPEGFHANDVNGVERITIGTTPAQGAKALITRDSLGTPKGVYTYDTETVDGASRTGQYLTGPNGQVFLLSDDGNWRLMTQPEGAGLRSNGSSRPQVKDGFGGWSTIAVAGTSTSSHTQPNHNHGIPHGTVFTDKSGVDHTWNESGGFTHSHTQN